MQILLDGWKLSNLRVLSVYTLKRLSALNELQKKKNPLTKLQQWYRKNKKSIFTPGYVSENSFFEVFGYSCVDDGEKSTFQETSSPGSLRTITSIPVCYRAIMFVWVCCFYQVHMQTNTFNSMFMLNPLFKDDQVLEKTLTEIWKESSCLIFAFIVSWFFSAGRPEILIFYYLGKVTMRTVLLSEWESIFILTVFWQVQQTEMNWKSFTGISWQAH